MMLQCIVRPQKMNNETRDADSRHTIYRIHAVHTELSLYSYLFDRSVERRTHCTLYETDATIWRWHVYSSQNYEQLSSFNYYANNKAAKCITKSKLKSKNTRTQIETQ